ncbi:intramembrane glutamic endopeptidase MroQ [Mammaliicoccus stepanovicii]|uniref:Abortive infection family protein n=1 Tax=Mammaliicoccus stepanovicii TaxID=643214 RepID=A0A239YR96_9STAP|nr:type II CAAX endopeptidase family protein [Mammaliicoccus stepanovicii]PNZ74790.1 CPBP family intramembrane metalloprotease [Mammaliicoccus stepanovicii]GGI42447.1 CAAX amino protease [Mammaliicoccus stepanovicii]SNV61053.1 abortive infection family protein [Mammaliicoccus stepanovicii]
MQFKRLTVNITTLILFAVVQLIAIVPNNLYKDSGLSKLTRLEISLTWMAVTAILTVLILWFMNSNIKNPTKLEQQTKEPWVYVIFWCIAGIFIAMFGQYIAGLINIYILKQPLESGNTQRLMQIAQESHILIIYIVFAGPILEELIFRKLIFGEIFNMIKKPKWFSFIVAVLVSSFVFSLAHSDPEHTLIYVVMGAIFSGLYVLTKRIIVPIIAHMGMNGIVVLGQIVFKDKIEEIEKQSQLAHTIYNTIVHMFN